MKKPRITRPAPGLGLWVVSWALGNYSRTSFHQSYKDACKFAGAVIKFRDHLGHVVSEG